MLVRTAAALALLVALSACGGGAAPTLAPGTTATPTAAATPGAGESIDSAGVQAAFDALENLDSWTFTSRYTIKSGESGIQPTVSGTERRQPLTAVDATHSQPDGSSFHYIRIGEDIWVDLGIGEMTHFDAATSENLIEQYEPSYIGALVDTVTGFTRADYDPMGTETVNGISAIHYQATETDRENFVQLYDDITPDQWAADVWIATEGGHLVRLAWGPQTPETAQATMGFVYEVTAVNCACPIEEPDNVSGG